MTAHSVNENFTKDGRRIICDWTNTPLKRDDGAVLGVLSMVQDVTERKRMEDELKRYSEHLEDLVQERTKELRQVERMTAIGQATLWVGHDLRNPLQVIVNTLYQAMDQIKNSPPGLTRDKRSLEMMSTVREQVRYMDKIVSDLHDYASPIQLEPVQTDLRQLIADALSGVDLPNSIRISLKVEESLPETIVDLKVVRRVFTNLIRNAVEAMPRGGQLTIQASRAGESTSITFEDTGIGIPEENMNRMFEPFFTTKSKGQGLGLAACKKLVDAHGGSIAIESKVGKGTKVTVTIPLDSRGKSKSASSL